MKDSKKTRLLAAIMFTDIVGYSALMQKDEDLAVKVRTHHREVFNQQHESHQGKLIQYYGDGTLSVFQSAIEAVECAIAIQQLLQEGEPVPLRIGLHMGDIVFNETEVYGDGVNIASRVESMGIAGAILLTGKLNDELKNHQQISTTSLGHFEFKNIIEPLEVFAVTNKGLKIPDSSQLKGKGKPITKTIAVLPFVNMSADEDNEYFSDGMTEEIINALAKIKTLKVTSRTSSFFFKNKDIPLVQIGQELNVSTILEGSVRLSGNMMRITAQLISVADDFHFWSETWDRKLENVFAIQDEISLLIAEKLREHLGHFEIQNQLVTPQTANIKAYENYLKGHYHYLKWSQRDVELAIDYLEKAIALDSRHAESLATLSGCYIYLAASGFLPPQEAFGKAKNYANKALELNDQLPLVYFALGGISLWYEWDFETAFAYIDKVLKINPSYADAHYSLAMVLMTTGKNELALKHINIAINLDPISPNHSFTKSWIYYMREEFAKALELTERIIEKTSGYTPAYIVWASALMLTGRHTKVIEHYKTDSNPTTDISTKLGLSAIAHVFNKDKESTEKCLKLLHEQLTTKHAGRALGFICIIHAVSGNTKEALDWLEKGLQSKSPLLLFLIDDPILNPIKGEQKYKEIRKSILGDKINWAIEEDKFASVKKERKALLDEETSKAYSQKLLALMEEEAPHLESSLSLKTLADLVDMRSNQLSWLLNEHFGKSFNDFINHYRVETFKQLAKDPQNAHITLIGLAYESGFNSKTVFNTYFKKETGETPKKWVKSAIE